jgi:hypothetical protein
MKGRGGEHEPECVRHIIYEFPTTQKSGLYIKGVKKHSKVSIPKSRGLLVVQQIY